jgi:hypothetical protein
MSPATVSTLNRITNTGFSYDAAGNMTADGSYTYQWDAESRMKSLNSTGVLYTYDGDGRRVKKSNGKMYWYASGLDAIAESDLTGALTAEYIFVNGRRAARLDLPAATVNYYFSDHLGSSNVVTGATGLIEDESDFYPFGGERVVTASTDNPYLFTGKERDAESNLDNFGVRYFASTMGRVVVVAVLPLNVGVRAALRGQQPPQPREVPQGERPSKQQYGRTGGGSGEAEGIRDVTKVHGGG